MSSETFAWNKSISTGQKLVSKPVLVISIIRYKPVLFLSTYEETVTFSITDRSDEQVSRRLGMKKIERNDNNIKVKSTPSNT